MLSALAKLFTNSINLYGSNEYNQGLIDIYKEKDSKGKITYRDEIGLDKDLLYKNPSGGYRGSFFKVSSITGRITNIGNIRINLQGVSF